MQEFVNGIFEFFRQWNIAVIRFFTNIGGAEYTEFNNWRYKSIFNENSLIGLNLTYRDFFNFLLPSIATFIIVILFIKFVFKLVSIFRV